MIVASHPLDAASINGVLPCSSVAEQVTSMVPKTKVLPEAGLQGTSTEPSTKSLADAE